MSENNMYTNPITDPTPELSGGMKAIAGIVTESITEAFWEPAGDGTGNMAYLEDQDLIVPEKFVTVEVPAIVASVLANPVATTEEIHEIHDLTVDRVGAHCPEILEWNTTGQYSDVEAVIALVGATFSAVMECLGALVFGNDQGTDGTVI